MGFCDTMMSRKVEEKLAERGCVRAGPSMLAIDYLECQ